VPIWKKEFYEDGSSWKENAEGRAHHAQRVLEKRAKGELA